MAIIEHNWNHELSFALRASKLRIELKKVEVLTDGKKGYTFRAKLESFCRTKLIWIALESSRASHVQRWVKLVYRPFRADLATVEFGRMSQNLKNCLRKCSNSEAIRSLKKWRDLLLNARNSRFYSAFRINIVQQKLAMSHKKLEPSL